MMIKDFISNLLVRRGFSRLVAQIRLLNKRRLTHEEVIEFLFSKDAELIRPWQFKEELGALAREIESINPSTILEIGTANGGTLFMSTCLALDNALIISIDLPSGEFGGGYPEWKSPVYKSFARKNQTIELIRANSHFEETFEKIKSILKGRKLDYLFIDGDHTYEGVKQDFNRYKSLVKEGGKIGMHDIVVHSGSTCNVHKFWKEIKEKYIHKEFVNDWDQNQFGVGLIDY